MSPGAGVGRVCSVTGVSSPLGWMRKSRSWPARIGSAAGWGDAVDGPVEGALERRRGQRVEVVLVGEQEHGGDACELDALAGGVGEELAGREVEAGVGDRFAPALEAG